MGEAKLASNDDKSPQFLSPTARSRMAHYQVLSTTTIQTFLWDERNNDKLASCLCIFLDMLSTIITSSEEQVNTNLKKPHVELSASSLVMYRTMHQRIPLFKEMRCILL